jgi:AraC-like DNA-binding protein
MTARLNCRMTTHIRHEPVAPTRTRQLTSGGTIDAQRHDGHQTVCAGRSVLAVTTSAGSRVAPGNRAIRVPAGTVHARQAHGELDLHLVGLPAADRRTLAEPGRQVGASGHMLSRLFRSELGMTFPQWRTQLRLRHALVLPAERESVTAVAHRCGWSSASAFIDVFRRTFVPCTGLPPDRLTAIDRSAVRSEEEGVLESAPRVRRPGR